jgi:hypothetical protein
MQRKGCQGKREKSRYKKKQASISMQARAKGGRQRKGRQGYTREADRQKQAFLEKQNRAGRTCRHPIDAMRQQ